MAYMMVANGDNYDVHQQGPDKKPTGKPLNKKPMPKAQASAFISSMMASDASSGKALTPDEIAEIETKCGDMGAYMPMPMKLDDEDPRVNYDPLGGRTGDKACANCRWFHPQSASCDLVYGPIVASGLSDLWLAAELPKPANTPNPMPVYIVEPDVDETDSGQMSIAGKASKSPDDYAYVPDKNLPSTWKLPINDEKHARLALAAISSNPPHGNRAQIPADAMPGVRKKIEAAIRKFVTDKKEVQKLLGGKSLIDQFLDFINGGEKAEASTDVADGFKVSPDGRWRAWWTNNAKDLVKENFSAKSIDAYIARVDKGIVPYPELWYKHLPVRMGKADAVARIGYMTFATGTFYDTPIGQKAKAYYLAEQAAGHPKTNSHGFLYPTNLKSNGVYHAFNTFEITVLDPGEEANPYTLFEVKTMFAKVSEDSKKFEELVKIFGKEEVEKLVNFGETKSRELEQTPGVDLKSLEKFDDVVVQDKSAHEAIKALGDATLAGLKKIGDRLDEISNAVATNQKAADDKAEASLKAISDLKSYVDEQFGYTPRASKAAQTQLAKDNAQVAQLKQANADAGKKTGDEPDPIVPETKSIFDHILAAAKTGAQ
jgi:hypothetical protein